AKRAIEDIFIFELQTPILIPKKIFIAKFKPEVVLNRNSIVIRNMLEEVRRGLEALLNTLPNSDFRTSNLALLFVTMKQIQ
ncbi:13832_t:CDS:1, partial [Gigaspora margarita]